MKYIKYAKLKEYSVQNLFE